MTDDEYNPNLNILEEIYPEVKKILSFQLKQLNNIKDDCLIVLDTNVLLLPFGNSPKSLDLIRSTFSNLITQNRLIIPGHVVREFVKNRPGKYFWIYDQLSTQKSKISDLDIFELEEIPLLESLDQFPIIKDSLKDLNEKIKEIQEFKEKTIHSFEKIMGIVRKWNWDDPVSKVYQNLFTDQVIYDFKYDKTEFVKDLEIRTKYKIPPGFKDYKEKGTQEEINYEGDLIIWKTILNIGKELKKDLIFVTQEKKSDWWYKKGSLKYPRYELVDEYRRASVGSSFHILDFITFLKLLDVKDETLVEEIRKEEEKIEVKKDFRMISPKYQEYSIFKFIRIFFPEISSLEETILSSYLAKYRLLYRGNKLRIGTIKNPRSRAHLKDLIKQSEALLLGWKSNFFSLLIIILDKELYFYKDSRSIMPLLKSFSRNNSGVIVTYFDKSFLFIDLQLYSPKFLSVFPSFDSRRIPMRVPIGRILS